jgi:hypothetical protein
VNLNGVLFGGFIGLVSNHACEFFLEAVEALECVFLGLWDQLAVLQLVFNAAHGGSESSVAVTAEHASSLRQPALAERPDGEPDLLGGEILASARVSLLGRCRDLIIENCRLILGRRFVVIEVIFAPGN